MLVLVSLFNSFLVVFRLLYYLQEKRGQKHKDKEQALAQLEEEQDWF